MRSKLVVVALVAALMTAGLFGTAAGQVNADITDPGRRPALGSYSPSVDPTSVRGAYRLVDGSWAVPLHAAKPHWLTPELEAAAKQRPTPAPQGDVPPPLFSVPGPGVDAAVSGFVGIRPGSWMVSPAGCTMNYVFGTPGNYSIGTAGHCVEVGEDVILLTIAPPNSGPCVPFSDRCVTPGVPVLVNIGRVAKSVDKGLGNDFAVVPVRPELQSWVYTTQAQVMGPCGKYTADGTLPDISVLPGRYLNPVEGGEGIFHYGHGMAVGTGGTPRAGAATGWGTDVFVWAGTAIYGDSGSAVRIHDLKAAGDLTHLVVPFVWGKYVASVGGTRITKMETIAGKSVANSPYCPPA